jgi:hypothetical protein
VAKINPGRLTQSPKKPQETAENQWLRRKMSVAKGLRKSALKSGFDIRGGDPSSLNTASACPTPNHS